MGFGRIVTCQYMSSMNGCEWFLIWVVRGLKEPWKPCGALLWMFVGVLASIYSENYMAGSV